MARRRIVAAVVVVLLAGCTTHQQASPPPRPGASLAGSSQQPTVSSGSPTPACGTAALPADSPNFCVAPPGFTGPLPCTAKMLQPHPDLHQPAVVEIATVMDATVRVIASSATFLAVQDTQADSQGHASVSFDVKDAAAGVHVDVKIELHLQDAPEADCATTFTPVAAAPASSP